MSLEQLLAWIPPGSPDETLARQINFEQLPAHIAVIMDGNGRWARKRRLPRIAGHRAGIAAVRDVVEASAGLEIQALTVYAFSKENWKRPKAEVDFLMDLLREYIRKEFDELHANGVRVQVIGRVHELPVVVQEELQRAIDATRGNTGLVFNLALSYGGRAEIVDACRELIREGARPEDVDEESFAQRHLPRVEGHRAGIDSVRDVVETSARLGIDVLTLYAFSVENWKRPRAEVSTLMTLLKRYLRLELNTLLKNDIRFEVIGRQDELGRDVREELEIAMQRTASNHGMLFNIALNYSGRAEIVDAARRIVAAGIDPADLDERRFGEFLYTAGQPDPDLLIRTSGEMRVSNFLLWQIAYAEIWVTDTLWPDFRCRHLLEAILAYQKRERRYGGIKSSGTPVAVSAK
jgi:undecaprenyl diphosphate synthase